MADLTQTISEKCKLVENFSKSAVLKESFTDALKLKAVNNSPLATGIFDTGGSPRVGPAQINVISLTSVAQLGNEAANSKLFMAVTDTTTQTVPDIAYPVSAGSYDKAAPGAKMELAVATGVSVDDIDWTDGLGLGLESGNISHDFNINPLPQNNKWQGSV